MNVGILTLTDTLGLIREYDGQIGSLWSLYAAVLGVMVALMTASKWIPRYDLLATGFGLFAFGNIYGLSLNFEKKRFLVAHAATMVSDDQLALNGLLRVLTPSPVWSMIMLHLALDISVIAAIIIYGRQARRAALVPAGSSHSE